MLKFYNLVWVTSSHGISAILAIITQVFLARFLSHQEFGSLILVQTFINIIEATFIARAGEVSLYWISRFWKEDFFIINAYRAYLLKEELIFNTTLYFIISLIAYNFSYLIELNYLWFQIMGLSIIAQTTYGGSKSIITSSGNLKILSRFEISFSICSFILLTSLTYLFGIYGFLWGNVIVPAIKTIVAYFTASSLLPHTKKAPLEKPPASLGLSLASISRNICNNFGAQIDIITLGILGSKESVAIYKIAKSLANLPVRASAPIWVLLRPQIIETIRTRKTKELQKKITLAGFILTLFSIFAYTFIFLYGEIIIKGLYGENYLQSHTILNILMIGTLFSGTITGWFSFISVTSSNKKAFVYITFINLVILTIASVFGNGDITHTALSITTANILTSLLAWAILFLKPEKTLG